MKVTSLYHSDEVNVQSFAARVTNGWSRDVNSLLSELLWPSLESRRLFQKICLSKNSTRLLHHSSHFL